MATRKEKVYWAMAASKEGGSAEDADALYEANAVAQGI